MVTSTVQISQQISSSPFPPNPPNHIPLFRLLFSKNCTAIRLRPPPLGEFADVERCWRMSVVTRESIRVSRSTSLITGRVRSRMSTLVGRIEGKYLWKKIVWRIPRDLGSVSFAFLFWEDRCKIRDNCYTALLEQKTVYPEKSRDGARTDGRKEVRHMRCCSPFTISFTDARSAKTSKIYSGGLRASIFSL